MVQHDYIVCVFHTPPLIFTTYSSLVRDCERATFLAGAAFRVVAVAVARFACAYDSCWTNAWCVVETVLRYGTHHNHTYTSAHIYRERAFAQQHR